MNLREKRTQFKKTCEAIVPVPQENVEITRVLTDEEQAEIAKRFEEARTDRELAETLGREGVRAVLKQKFADAARHGERTSRHFDKR